MVTKVGIGIGMVAALGFLAACAAPAQWEKPGVTGGEASKAAAQCRAFASHEADRKYRRDNPVEDRGYGGPADSFQNTMAVNDAALFRNKVYNECMESHGYKRMGGAK